MLKVAVWWIKPVLLIGSSISSEFQYFDVIDLFPNWILKCYFKEQECTDIFYCWNCFLCCFISKKMSCYLAEDNLQVLLLLGKKFCVIRFEFCNGAFNLYHFCPYRISCLVSQIKFWTSIYMDIHLHFCSQNNLMLCPTHKKAKFWIV